MVKGSLQAQKTSNHSLSLFNPKKPSKIVLFKDEVKICFILTLD